MKEELKISKQEAEVLVSTLLKVPGNEWNFKNECIYSRLTNFVKDAKDGMEEKK